MKGKLDTSIKDIFTAINTDIKHIPVDISVPNDYYQELLDYFLERGYLNALPEREQFVDFRKIAKKNLDMLPVDTKLKNEADFKNITWLKVERLPIHPNEAKEYDLLSRWQSVLSTLHTWGHRLIFLLQRRSGETHLYLGTTSLSRAASSAVKRLSAAQRPARQQLHRPAYRVKHYVYRGHMGRYYDRQFKRA